jgi:D-aminoacyl-tRNA deacylase
MRVVIQRVKYSKVEIRKKVVGKCDEGYLLLVGFTNNDNEKIIDKVVNKIINLRIFPDENDLMNKSILDINGNILSISQFTLYADVSNGRRPSFVNALNPNEASKLYDLFNEKLSKYVHAETGVFKENMEVSLLNSGPCTIIIDSCDL